MDRPWPGEDAASAWNALIGWDPSVTTGSVPVMCEHCGRDLERIVATAPDGRTQRIFVWCPACGVVTCDATRARESVRAYVCPGGATEVGEIWGPAPEPLYSSSFPAVAR